MLHRGAVRSHATSHVSCNIFRSVIESCTVTVVTPVTSSICALVTDRCFGCPVHRRCHGMSLPCMKQRSHIQGNNKETSCSFAFDPFRKACFWIFHNCCH